MKNRIINFLKRLGFIVIFYPIAIVALLIGAVLAVPYWIITGENIADSKADRMMQNFADYFEND